MTTILVLHGPNMALKGAEGIDETLDTRASELGVELATFQGNSEGALLDELHRQHLEIDAIIVNPGVLAPAAWALAEAVSLVKKPTVEVLLGPLPQERGPSTLAALVRAQVHDKAEGGYVFALELLVKELGVKPASESGEAPPSRIRGIGRGPEKSIGRKPLPAAETTEEATAHLGKTIGRKSDGAAKPATMSSTSGLTRAAVREKLKARLGGTLTADALAAWARTEWSRLSAGGACEESHRATLDGILLTVMSGAKATDAIVLAQLARLEQ